MKLRIIVAALVAFVVCLHASHAADQNMGVISFENSGAPAAQADFIGGLAALHNSSIRSRRDCFSAHRQRIPASSWRTGAKR